MFLSMGEKNILPQCLYIFIFLNMLYVILFLESDTQHHISLLRLMSKLYFKISKVLKNSVH